jgi:hypothetical protein
VIIDPHDGVAWRDAVLQCAYAMRRGDSDAADMLERLQRQASGRQKHEAELLRLLIDDELLPEIKKGRPAGVLTKTLDIMSASQAYFDLTKTDPSGPLRQKPKGEKGHGAAASVGKPHNVGERTVQQWLPHYRAAVKELDLQGYDGRALLRSMIEANRTD